MKKIDISQFHRDVGFRRIVHPHCEDLFDLLNVKNTLFVFNLCVKRRDLMQFNGDYVEWEK